MQRFLVFLLICASTISIQSSVLSQTDKSPPKNKTQDVLNEKSKKQVIDAFVKSLQGTYLYPDRIAGIQKHLQSQWKSGAYKEPKSHFAFAQKLSGDIRAYTKDLHFSIRHSGGDGSRFGAIRLGPQRSGRPGNSGGSRPQPPVRIGSGATIDPDSPIFKMLHEQFRKNNFSMPKLEVLPGNVGYLRLDMMPPLEVAKPTVDAAMMFLSNTDAMIIDVRDTPGGVGGFIPYLMSYYFEEPDKVLYTRYFGAEDRTEKYHTHKKLGGKRRPDVPLFVLTSRSTGSAAENLSFTLKHHGRAETVGETTRGGGHSATMVPLIDGFTATIPIADVIHPVTGKGFDGVGVLPSHKVAASVALEQAHELALEKLLTVAKSSAKASLQKTLDEVRAAKELKKLGSRSEQFLKSFVGNYGNRNVFFEAGKLRYQREGGPAVDLIPTGKDRFRLKTPAGVRSALALPDIRFDRDNEKNVVGFSLILDGKIIESVKLKK